MLHAPGMPPRHVPCFTKRHSGVQQRPAHAQSERRLMSTLHSLRMLIAVLLRMLTAETSRDQSERRSVSMLHFLHVPIRVSVDMRCSLSLIH